MRGQVRGQALGARPPQRERTESAAPPPSRKPPLNHGREVVEAGWS